MKKIMETCTLNIPTKPHRKVKIEYNKLYLILKIVMLFLDTKFDILIHHKLNSSLIVENYQLKKSRFMIYWATLKIEKPLGKQEFDETS